MAKGDKFYFDNFAASAALSKEAAEYLVKCLENYESENIEQMMTEMHEIEHKADTKKHEVDAALAKAFVTPVDREDLDMLSHQLDDVTDKIEEVLQAFYMNNIKTVQPSAIEFAKNIVKACDMLCVLMAEFENFKRSKNIQQLIIDLNDVEEDCDKLYLKSIRTMSLEGADALTVIAWRDVYECLEACADACEHVSECIGTVIMKNT